METPASRLPAFGGPCADAPADDLVAFLRFSRLSPYVQKIAERRYIELGDVLDADADELDELGRSAGMARPDLRRLKKNADNPTSFLQEDLGAIRVRDPDLPAAELGAFLADARVSAHTAGSHGTP